MCRNSFFSPRFACWQRQAIRLFNVLANNQDSNQSVIQFSPVRVHQRWPMLTVNPTFIGFEETSSYWSVHFSLFFLGHHTDSKLTGTDRSGPCIAPIAGIASVVSLGFILDVCEQ